MLVLTATWGNLKMITPSERGQGRQKRALTAWPHFYNTLDSVQLLSHVQLLATAWTAARQASLSITNFQSLLKLMPIKSVMPSHHRILCRPLLLPPSIFPSISVFPNESALHIRWPKYWSFIISLSSEYSEDGITTPSQGCSEYQDAGFCCSCRLWKRP